MAMSTMKHLKEANILNFIQGCFGEGSPVVKSRKRKYHLIIDGYRCREKIVISELPEKNLRMIFENTNQNLYEKFGRMLEVRGNYIFVTAEV